jgi:hypothetical protein
MVEARAVAEFLPFHAGPAGKVSAGLVLVMLACAVARRRELRAGEVFWLFGSIVLLMRMGRFAPLFAIVAAPIFAATLPRLSDGILSRPLTVAAVVAVLGVGLVRVVAAFPGRDVPIDAWVNRHGADAPGYPAAAAAYVEQTSPRAPAG